MSETQGPLLGYGTVGTFLQVTAPAAVTAPTANDDEDVGFSRGSRKFNRLTGIPYLARTVEVGAAVWDEEATAAATQTLAAKTLTTPTIGSFTNAQHDHSDAAGGGALAEKYRTHSHIFYVVDPVAGDLVPAFCVPAAATITRVGAKVDTGSLTLSCYKRDEATPDTGTTAIVSSQSVTTTHGAKTIASAGMTARQWFVPTVVSIDSGTPTKLWVNIEYTVD